MIADGFASSPGATFSWSALERANFTCSFWMSFRTQAASGTLDIGVQSPGNCISRVRMLQKADVAMSIHTMKTPSTYHSNKASQVELLRNRRAPLSSHVCHSAAKDQQPPYRKKWRPPSACVYPAASLVIVSRTPPMPLATSAPWVAEERNTVLTTHTFQ